VRSGVSVDSGAGVTLGVGSSFGFM
jgi:hypothetical protein